MRPHALPFLALAGSVLALASCAQISQPGGSDLTVADIATLDSLEALPANRPVQIQTQFNDGSNVIAAPSVVARSGETAAIEIASEVAYPTRFTLPQTTAAAGNAADGGSTFPVTPAQPDQLTQAPTGLTLECTPEIVGAFIEIKGRVVFRWSEESTNTAAVGEGIGIITTDDGRVVISENRHELPVFGSRSTPFFVRARPGETYTLSVRGEENLITIDLTVSLMEPDRGELAARVRTPYFVAAR